MCYRNWRRDSWQTWGRRALLVGLVGLGSASTSVAFAEEDVKPAGVFDPSEGAYGPPIDDANPEASVPDAKAMDADPLAAAYLVMELSVRAERAEAEKDIAAAVRYFRALAKAFPDRALAFSKLCQHYAALGERENAIASCRRATELPGAKLADHLSYAALLLAQSPPGETLAPSVVSELDATFSHLEGQKIDAPEVDVLMCKLGLKLEDVARLRSCVERLEKRDPDGALTLSHQFSLALLERDFSVAENVLERARAASLPADALALMQDELEARQAPGSTARITQLVGGAFTLAFLVWALSALWRRRLTATA